MNASDRSLLLIAILGPTASGKSAVAEAVADRLPAELVAADAMQAYAGLPILTNQPERPTRLVGVWPLDHEGTVGEYQQLAHEAIDEILATGRTPVLVGGTGLYLRAALAELDLPPAASPGTREHWEEVYDRLGPERAHATLAMRDPAAGAAVHPNDRRRVVRALELTDLGASLHPGRNHLWSEETRHPSVLFGLEVPRDVLADRIRARTQAMFEHGVEDEVAGALARPISETARKTMGLAEIAEGPREKAIEALTRRTLQYAAYQRKWLRRIPGVVSLAGDRSPGAIADEILEVARSRQRLPARRAG